MVLWEITAATAYFLGLKRTYRIALRLQRRIFGPRRNKIRQFLHRRTRGIFDVAVSVHKNIQHRDLEAGRNIGNCILRLLDRIKPSAEIRGSVGKQSNVSSSTEISTKSPNLNSVGKHPDIRSSSSTESNTKPLHLNNSLADVHRPSNKSSIQGGNDGRRHFTSLSMNSMPAIMMTKKVKQMGMHALPHRYNGVLRKDIALWMYGKWGIHSSCWKRIGRTLLSYLTGMTCDGRVEGSKREEFRSEAYISFRTEKDFLFFFYQMAISRDVKPG